MINAANAVGLNPKDWRNRAEEARVVAESMQDEQSKQLLRCVAKELRAAHQLMYPHHSGLWRQQMRCRSRAHSRLLLISFTLATSSVVPA
jgi:ketol-acid reductoisomerase